MSLAIASALLVPTVGSVSADAPSRSISIQKGAVLLAQFSPADGRNTQLMVVGNDGRYVTGAVPGANGTFAFSLAFISGVQDYCDGTTNSRVLRYINGGGSGLPANAVQVSGSARSGSIHTTLRDVFISEYHWTYPDPGCTGLDPSFTSSFGSTNVTLDLSFAASGPSTGSTGKQTYTDPGRFLSVSMSDFTQCDAAVSGSFHATESAWDLGSLDGVPAPLAFIGRGGSTSIVVWHP
jgi:hypothetical protein